MNDSTRFDWTPWIYPGPQRVFTPDELRRAGGDAWPDKLSHYLYVNVLVLVLIFYNEMPRTLAPWVLVGALALVWMSLGVARMLWRQPTRRRLNVASASLALCVGAGGLALIGTPYRDSVRTALPFVAAALTLILSAWWFLTVYRSQQIATRLGEQEAQAQRVQLALRLATAQIQPHFLFNTLASLQHWVDTRDERAGPVLRSLTRYLRATLPMFAQDRLAVAQELQIVRSYLEIMQARLGGRLRWHEEPGPGVDEALLQRASLPPGSLLTLVENAITHGIEPSLRGGAVRLGVAREGQVLRLSVRDEGQGLSPDAHEGLGLRNTRERLRAQFGDAARLQLQPAEPGCLAWMEIPLPEDDAR
ncbi:histidine kinase [Pelomonas sp. CA6]|uniref:sensor histidine kinase n=1 Tax=Pelomonas sp. CA6 TaxID=2907999 RepID=UPI001F4C4BED|nr:histidine kinase [Pelomonas sp. CA6]MCH7343517.1 histidine kinase [Pelomonas sp. CA6]